MNNLFYIIIITFVLQYKLYQIYKYQNIKNYNNLKLNKKNFNLMKNLTKNLIRLFNKNPFNLVKK